VDDFYAARSRVTPPLPWPTFSPPFSVKALAEQFGAKPGEVRRLLDGHLEIGRTRELADMMRTAGLPM